MACNPSTWETETEFKFNSSWCYIATVSKCYRHHSVVFAPFVLVALEMDIGTVMGKYRAEHCNSNPVSQQRTKVGAFPTWKWDVRETIDKNSEPHKQLMGFWLPLQTTQMDSILEYFQHFKSRTGEPTIQVDRLLETTRVVWSLVVL